MDDQKNLVLAEEYIRKHSLAVVSTVNDQAKPESAVVGIAVGDNFELIFGTSSTSRKYKNLLNNPSVSLVIGWEGGKTVQFQGEAYEITEQAEIDHALRTHFAKTPSAVKYMAPSVRKLFRIKPKWLSYTDVSTDPWEKFEIIF